MFIPESCKKGMGYFVLITVQNMGKSDINCLTCQYDGTTECFKHCSKMNWDSFFQKGDDDDEKMADAIVTRIQGTGPKTDAISGLRSVKGKVLWIALTVMRRIEVIRSKHT
jgi:hypothetical protein